MVWFSFFGSSTRAGVVRTTAGAMSGFAWAASRRYAQARCDAGHTHGTVPGDDIANICHRKTWGVPWIEDWDNPQQLGLPTQSRDIKRQIILVRHGQYSNESTSREDEQHRLTDLGHRQAVETGKYLAHALATSPLYRAKTLYNVSVSDLMRAKQTCEDMIAGLRPVLPTDSEPLVDPLLREIFPCDPQPPYSRKKARPESERIIEAAYGKYFHRPTRGESSVELVVAHANVIRYFLCRALQIPPEAWLRFSLPHCSLTVITIDGRGRVSVNAVGSVNHLPPEMQSVMNVA